MSEVIGKIFTLQEAEESFGAVTRSFIISANELLKFSAASGEKVMFRFYPGFVAILGEGRVVLSPSGFEVNPNDEFRVVSPGLLKELIERGNNSNCIFELRGTGDTFCIRNEGFVLENTFPCPPYC